MAATILQQLFEALEGNEMKNLVKGYWVQGSGGLLAAYLVYKFVLKKYVFESEGQKKIRLKRAKFEAKKEALRAHLEQDGVLVTSKRKQILQLNINQLITRLQNDALDPVEVLEAYQARALEANEVTNAICDFMDESLEEAKKLKMIAKGQRGPLHGVPVSIKVTITLMFCP